MLNDLPDAAWRKSGRSTDTGQCVELTDTPEVIGVRDSKDPTGPKLAFDRRAWSDFSDAVKRGQHDL